MANLLTLFRILCSISLIFLPALSVPFSVVYAAAGISDAADGYIARKTGTVSSFGSVFDTAADLVFFAVCFCKLIPVLSLSFRAYAVIASIALFKIFSIIAGYIKYKRIITVHNFMNRFTGILLFIFPLTLQFIDKKYSVTVLCISAFISAVYELIYILNSGRKK